MAQSQTYRSTSALAAASARPPSAEGHPHQRPRRLTSCAGRRRLSKEEHMNDNSDDGGGAWQGRRSALLSAQRFVAPGRHAGRRLRRRRPAGPLGARPGRPPRRRPRRGLLLERPGRATSRWGRLLERGDTRLLEVLPAAEQRRALPRLRPAPSPISGRPPMTPRERWPLFVPACPRRGGSARSSRPLRLRDETIGGLNLFNTAATRPWSPRTGGSRRRWPTSRPSASSSSDRRTPEHDDGRAAPARAEQPGHDRAGEGRAGRATAWDAARPSIGSGRYARNPTA